VLAFTYKFTVCSARTSFQPSKLSYGLLDGSVCKPIAFYSVLRTDCIGLIEKNGSRHPFYVGVMHARGCHGLKRNTCQYDQLVMR
jgi:hypothetical protein